MGDLNAQSGDSKISEEVWDFGVEAVSENGELMLSI